MGPSKESFLKKQTINTLMTAPWRADETYVTRGAYMYCTMGTHEEVLNQRKENGVYINGSPMMTVNDCVVSSSEHINGVVQFDRPGQEIDGNFYSFGYCRSLMHPLKLAELSGTFIDSSYIYDYDPDTGTESFDKKIFPCVPQIAPNFINTPIGPLPLPGAKVQWQNGSPSVFIEDVAVLTSKSCLNCLCGGKIEFLTNGMDPAPYEFLERGSK